MPTQLRLFMAPQDEVALVRYFERFKFEVYPRRVPQDWQEFRATAAELARFPEEELYLAATEIGAVQVDTIKRGKDRGAWRVDEVRSPVVFWERCRKNEDGELLSGQLWAQNEVTEQTGRKDPAPERFRALVQDIDQWVRTNYRKGHPKPFLVGAHCARLVKEERLVLRVNEHRGGTVEVVR
ncbi:MAG: hypothetical protein K1X89_18790 [Myxococcaceae bacterium]|nr:hypothetical protein [Myxococcaceae bacterium]